MAERRIPGPCDETDAVAPENSGAKRWLVAMWSGGSLLRDLPDAGALTIGRGEDVEVRIDDGSISRRHARLLLRDTLQIEDLGSSNGTWVDGRRLASGAVITARPGALIELGKALLVVHEPGSEAAAGSSSAADGIVVSDPAMERVHQLVTLAARSSLNVLLFGETGVGKEVFASLLHARSHRADRPFLKINCAALVESLLEAELFGYEKGAFTGAHASKPGLLEASSSGTLFLDEVGELPLTTQAKLLRVLESGEVTRVGSLKPRPIDVRFVAATNRDLKDGIATGWFRKDLYFRLEGVAIRIPPLRERPSEIAALARLFTAQACAASGRPPAQVSTSALTSLVGHSWPGNARELRNVMARAVLLCTGDVIGPESLHFGEMGSLASEPPAPNPMPSAPVVTDSSLFEAQPVLDALAKSAGNQTRAARLLGISRSTLVRRLDAMKAPRPRK